MKAIIEKELGIPDVQIKELNGYDNKNYLVRGGNNSFIFKTYTPKKHVLPFVKAENKALLFLQSLEAVGRIGSQRCRAEKQERQMQKCGSHSRILRQSGGCTSCKKAPPPASWTLLNGLLPAEPSKGEHHVPRRHAKKLPPLKRLGRDCAGCDYFDCVESRS